MPLRIEAHEEPILGYRLIERLGSGGFGEVWKAEAPGGLFKAIKFVQRGAPIDEACAIGGADNDRSRADQEMKSLSRVKTVHHPYVISLDRFEVVDDYLVIVMELADRTLSDRFKQCRSQGLPGVPRLELLGYLDEAAEALDLMNSLYQLQHLDIKPQNLFLVHNHIKVADFGLVKDITDQKFMTITGGVTPVYAAPETFDGKFSRQSDQYSLAIVYQEILTGHRPFTGTTMKQLILQHLQNAHDLTPAPVHDRPIIARALSKNPEDRFQTCVEFVAALRRATLKYSGSDDESRPAAPVSNDKSFPSVSKTQGARGGAGPVKPVDPNFSVGKAFLGPDVPPSAEGHAEEVTSLRSEPLAKSMHTPTLGPKHRAKPQRPSATASPGIVQPALIVGIGQLGVDTLAQVRQRIATELGSGGVIPHIRLIGIDTDPEALQRVTAGEPRTALRTGETLFARLQRPSHYLKVREGKLPTDSWLNQKLLYRIPREQGGAGARALGRLAFVDNYRGIAKRLEAELLACCSQDTPHDSEPPFDLGLRSTRPRVYLVSSLTGNTGSGMIFDVAYLLRKLLNEQGHSGAEIIGLFYLPSARRDAASPAAQANACASLLELQYYCQPEAIFSAHYETAASQSKGERVREVGPALQRCIFLPLPEPRGKRSELDNTQVVAQAGDFLYRDLATVLGQAIDEQRAVKLRAAAEENPNAGLLLQSIGTYRILWPRHALLEQGARRLGTQLVTRWMSKDAGHLADSIREWTHERWETLGMRSENLIERFQQLAESSLQQKPEQMLADILGPMQTLVSAPPSPKAVLNMGPIVQTMDGLERIIGIPEEGRTAKQTNAEPSLMERTLADIAHVIADECEQKLAELAVTLLEDPNFRLAGAEEALRQFCTTVELSLKSQETLAKELAEKAGQLYVRILQWVEKPLPANAPTSTQWAFSLARRPMNNSDGPSGADLFELVRTYTKTRYHSLVLAHLNRLYLGLRGHLSDQIREVGFCRQRLGELRGLLHPASLTPHKNAPPPSDQRALFPPGCVELRDAVEQLSKSITAEDVLAFDERVQVWIKAHCQALLQVCMGSATLVKNLAPAILQEAEAFLSDRLQGASVAEMYLAGKRAGADESADDAIFDDLERCLDEATPEFGKLGQDNVLTLVTFPNDASGTELQEILKKGFRDAKCLLTERADEIIFYHEIVNIPWKNLEQLGPIAMDMYRQRSAADPSSLHTREDVFQWEVLAATNR